MRLINVSFFAWLASLPGFAQTTATLSEEWEVRGGLLGPLAETGDEPKLAEYGGVTWRRVKPALGEDRSAVMAYLKPIFRTAILDQPKGSTPESYLTLGELVEAWESGGKRTYSVAINGGYFKKPFAYDGLFRLNGKTISPFAPKPVLSGIVAIDKDRRLHLLPALFENAEKFPHALQAGPFLVDPGGKFGIRNKGGPRTRRSVIALTTSGNIVLLATQPATLYETASLLVNLKEGPVEKGQQPKPERIERALNLDGGPSTAFLPYLNDPEISRFSARGPIRNGIVFY